MFQWLKKYWIGLVPICFLVAIMDVTVSSTITCHPPSKQSSQAAETKQQDKCTALRGPVLLSLKAFVEFMDDHGEAVSALFTIVLAMFTAALWRSTDKLWEAGERQLKLATNTAQQQLRAYVSIVPTTFGGFKEGQIPRIGWRTKNHGQTPATHIVHCFAMGILQNPIQPNFQFPEPDRRIDDSFSLFPQDDVPTHFNHDRALGTPDIVSIAANAQHFHIWGFTEYEDVFKNRWRIRINVSVGGQAFAEAMRPRTADMGGEIPKWNWEYGHGHNDIEEA